MKGQQEVAEYLVSRLPEELFVNPDTTFLDIAMGGGQYLDAVVKRCEKYHDRGQILPRVYGIESGLPFVIHAKRYYNLRGSNFYYTTDKLPEMKFDVVIGNPPYSLPKGSKTISDGKKNLALQFIEKAISLTKEGGYISMLTPPNFLKPTDSSKASRAFGSLKGLKLESVETGIERDWFQGIFSQILLWSGTVGQDTDKFSMNGRDWDLNETPFVVDLKDDELDLFMKIWKKMKSGKNPSTCTRVGDGKVTPQPGWSMTPRVSRRKSKELVWGLTTNREKWEQIHIDMDPETANKLFQQPHVKFFLHCIDVEPTLYHNLLNGLDFGPMKLTKKELKVAEEFLLT